MVGTQAIPAEWPLGYAGAFTIAGVNSDAEFAGWGLARAIRSGKTQAWTRLRGGSHAKVMTHDGYGWRIKEIAFPWA
jgi:hypothetical protein